MNPSVRATVLSLGMLSSLLSPSRSQAQVLAKTLLFNSVQPCRVADTRAATAGILLGGAPRTFNVVGATTNYGSQGGVAGGCGIPGFVGGVAQVQAVAINVVAVNPSGDGFLTAWPSDQPFPPASTVNFQKLVPNLNIANGVIVPVRQDSQGGDITIVTGVSNAHVVVDITGYFSKAAPRRFYLTANAGVTGGNALLECAAGYHMASLSEIFDTSSLSYNTSLGVTRSDSGTGAPRGPMGWIRTGANASISTTPGQGNCNSWITSAPTSHGTFAGLVANWAAGPSAVSPWFASVTECSVPQPVWCVED